MNTDFVDMFSSGISNVIDQKKKKENKRYLTPYLYKSETDIVDYTFIVNKPLSEPEIHILKKKIKSHGLMNYQILYALQLKLTEKDEGKTIWKQYRDFKWDYTKYIPAHTKVFSFGETLFSICESNDLDGRLVSDEENDNKKKETRSIIEGFYDTLLWETSFYDPKTKCQVFPVDGWEKLFDPVELLINNFENYFFSKQIELAKKFTCKVRKLPYIEKVRVNPNAFLRQHLHEKDLIALDTETKGVDPFSKKGKIVCVTIAYTTNMGFYLPWEEIDLDLLVEFLKDRPIIGSNIKYDVKWLVLKGGIPLTYFNIVGDTMILQQTVNELQRRGLKGAAFLYTTIGGYDAPLNKYLEDHPEVKNDYSLIPEPILFPYATTDPCASLLVHKKLVELMGRLDSLVNSNNQYGYSLSWIYNDLKIPVLRVFIEIELEGMEIDKDILKKQSEKIQKDVYDLETDILNDLNETRATFKLNSSDDLGKKLKSLGWPIKSFNKKNLPNVGEEQLKDWEKKGYTIATKILSYRKQMKLLTTYIGIEEDGSGMYKWIRDDGKIHSAYDVFGALSGRHKSKEPNGQNWVSHGDYSQIVRSFIVPPPDCIFSSGDFSGLQLRLAAMVSGDANMREAFTNENPEERDLHIVTAFNTMLKYVMDIDTLEKAKEILSNQDDIRFKEVKDYRFKAKCFVKGTKILTNKGSLAVETFIPEVNKGEHTPYYGDIKIVTDKDYSIESTFYDTTTDTIEFELDNGDILEVTPDHEMIVMREGQRTIVEAQYVLETDELISEY